jgi:hypothetical protein
MKFKNITILIALFVSISMLFFNETKANDFQYGGEKHLQALEVPIFDVTKVAQGQSNVKFKFKFKFKWIGSYDYWWLVDDLRILFEIPAPEIVVVPESITIEVKQGFTNAATFNISNPGDANLEFSLYAIANQPERSFTYDGVTAYYEGFDVEQPFEKMIFLDEKNKAAQADQIKAIGDPVELLYDIGSASAILTNSAADWISFDITEEVVKPLHDIDIEITFNAAGLDLGNYYADVIIVNNTGENVILPVTMTVIPAAFNVEFVIIDNLSDPVVDAVVQLDETTNDPGVYLFENISIGTHPYTVTKAGFYTTSGTAFVRDNNIIITLKLIPEGASIFNVSVSIEDEFAAVVENALFRIDNIGTFLSDENGEICFIALEDTYSYSVSKYGFEIIEDEVFIDEDKTFDITMIYLRYNLSLIAVPEFGGTLSGDGIYYHGETATVNAVPAEFYNFLSWKKNGVIVAETSEYVFDVMQNTELTAHFELFRHNITATANPIVGGVINGTGEYINGDPVILTAYPASGYHFVKWTEDEIEIADAGAIYSFNAYEDRDLVAHFELTTYTLTFSAKDQDGTTILDATVTFDGDEYKPGVYVFTELLPGTYPYVVAKVGYFDASGNVTISNSNKTQNVVLNIDNTNIENLFYEEFSVYPNPVSDLLNIKSEELINEIIIFDIAGRKMMQILPSEINVEINMNNLRSGVYFIKIIGVNTTTIVKVQKQ